MSEFRSFASFLGNNTEAASAAPETIEQTETTTAVTQDAAGTEATAEVATQEQVTPSTAAASVSLAALLEKRGVQIEGGDSEELYESVVSRALAGSQAMSEVARLREELESLRATAQQSTPSAPQQTATHVSQPTEGTAVAQQQARLFRELQKYDPLLETYVERDESGYAKPVAAYGQLSIDAARQINDYQRASREQADMILRNPLAIVEDSRDVIAKIAEERARQIAEEQIGAIRNEIKQEALESAAAVERKTAVQQEYEWHEANKAKLFHLDANGEPKKDFLGSDSPAWTSTGRLFLQKLGELRNQLKGAPEMTLRNLAIELATVGQAPATNSVTPAPVAQSAAATAPAPVLTQSQQRTLLAQNRQTIPNSNTPVADVRQIMKSAPRLELSSMARLDPNNAERISGWRN